MPSKDPISVLRDILTNIEAARGFVTGLSFHQFVDDRRTMYAVVRALEIVSETSRRLPTDMKEKSSNVPWRSIAAAGNAYRHDYGALSMQRIWRTVNEELDDLELVVRQELERLGKE